MARPSGVGTRLVWPGHSRFNQSIAPNSTARGCRCVSQYWTMRSETDSIVHSPSACGVRSESRNRTACRMAACRSAGEDGGRATGNIVVLSMVRSQYSSTSASSSRAQ